MTIDLVDIREQLEKFKLKGKEFHKTHGFNSASSKDESSHNIYIMTDYVSGYTKVLNKKTNRYNNKPIYSPIYESLDDAFRNNNSQRQVFAGINHYRRDIAVCDIDASEYYFPCFTEEDRFNRISHIHNLCKSYELPRPSYIEFHNDSGNCQFGWYLTEYFTSYNRPGNEDKSNTYKDLIQALAFLFKSDKGFKGGNIKNPYHELNTVYVNNLNPINTESFISRVSFVMESLGKKFHRERGSKDKKTLSKENYSYGEDTSSITSRNCYALSKTRSWVFAYMRNNQGKLPSFGDTFKVFEGFEYQILPKTGKKYIEDSTQIAASTRSVLDFCKKHYNAKKAQDIIKNSSSKEIQDLRRQSSIITNQARAAIKYFRVTSLLKQGFSQGEISKELGCTQASISILLKKYSVEQCISYMGTYVKLHINSQVEKHIKLINSIKEILPLINITLDSLIFEENQTVEKVEAVSFTLLEFSYLEELLGYSYSNNLLCHKDTVNTLSIPRGDPFHSMVV